MNIRDRLNDEFGIVNMLELQERATKAHPELTNDDKFNEWLMGYMVGSVQELMEEYDL